MLIISNIYNLLVLLINNYLGQRVGHVEERRVVLQRALGRLQGKQALLDLPHGGPAPDLKCRDELKPKYMPH